MNCLVTGGAGFIGSHLCDRLLQLGHKVICVDNFDDYYPAQYKKQNIARALKNPNFIFYEIDVTKYEKIAPIFELYKIDAIIHLAGRGGVGASVERPLFYVHTNVHGTLCMLEAARHYHVSKFIFASSSSVYGPESKPPFNENDPVLNQASPYGATKRAAELLVQTYHNLYGIQSVVLRFFTVYGPRSRPDMAINKFTLQIMAGEEVSARQGMKRDFTYVDDVVSGIVSALDKNINYEIINLGNCTPITVQEYIQAVEKALGIKAKVVIKDPLPGELLETMADITKAKKILGFKPKTRIEEGVLKFVEWYKTNRQDKKGISKRIKSTKMMIFDFDGTIINAEKEKANIFGEIVKKYWKGDKKAAAKFYFDIAGPARKFKFDFYYRKLFNKPLSNKDYQLIEQDFSSQLIREIYPDVKPVPGGINLLKYVHNHFNKVYICSAVPVEEISYLIEKLKLTKYFDRIMGTEARYPTKLTMFEEIIAENSPALTFYVADGTLDMRMAKEIGIVSIGVPSNKSAEELKSAGADYVTSIEKCPEVLETAINKLM